MDLEVNVDRSPLEIVVRGVPNESECRKPDWELGRHEKRRLRYERKRNQMSNLIFVSSYFIFPFPPL